MPYIKADIRPLFDGQIIEISRSISNVGELNYVITSMIREFLGKHARYSDYNAVIGVLECAKLEVYRRAVAPYEDQKIAENGDVY